MDIIIQTNESMPLLLSNLLSYKEGVYYFRDAKISTTYDDTYHIIKQGNETFYIKQCLMDGYQIIETKME